MIKIMFHFLFGFGRQQYDHQIKQDDDKAKNLLDQIKDEPIDLLAEEENYVLNLNEPDLCAQDVSPAHNN